MSFKRCSNFISILPLPASYSNSDGTMPLMPIRKATKAHDGKRDVSSHSDDTKSDIYPCLLMGDTSNAFLGLDTHFLVAVEIYLL
jgi:hypothetical protein